MIMLILQDPNNVRG